MERVASHVHFDVTNSNVKVTLVASHAHFDLTNYKVKVPSALSVLLEPPLPLGCVSGCAGRRAREGLRTKGSHQGEHEVACGGGARQENNERMTAQSAPLRDCRTGTSVVGTVAARRCNVILNSPFEMGCGCAAGPVHVPNCNIEVARVANIILNL